jgi:hypothetical protein
MSFPSVLKHINVSGCLSVLGCLTFAISCRPERLSGRTNADKTNSPTSPASGTSPSGTNASNPTQGNAEQLNPPGNSGTTNGGSAGNQNNAGSSSTNPNSGSTSTSNSGSGSNSTTPMQNGTDGVSISGDVDSEAVKKCLKIWGKHPFKTVTPTNYKKLSGGFSAFGININPPKDTETSSEDKLIVIDFGANYKSTALWKLMNPKGWYCVKAYAAAGDATTQAQTNIELHCTAKLANTNLAVSFDSDKGQVGVNTGGQSGAQLGIYVDAKTSVTRKSTNGSGCN